MNGPVGDSDESWTNRLRTRLALSPHYQWYVVGMLWWISFFNYADRQAVFSVFPLLKDDMGLSMTERGWLGSSFAWVYGLAAPFAGLLVDRVLRKKAILGGLHVWSVICLATALSRRFWHLLAFRAAEGLGECLYYPASMSLLSDYHGNRTRSTALGLHQTSVYAGTIGGGALAGFIGQRLGWQSSFVFFGSLGVLLGFALQRFLVEPQRGRADAEDGSQANPPARLPIKETLRLIATTPTALLLMAGFAFAMFGNIVLLTWMPNFLHDRFNLSLGQAGFDATFYPQMASIAGAALGGYFSDRLRQRIQSGRILVQALGVFCAAPFVYFCGREKSAPMMLAILVGWGLCKGLYDANIFASVYEVIPPAARGSVAGFMNLAGWGGGAFAPLLVGVVADKYNLGLAISMVGSVYVLSGMVLLVAGSVFLKRDITRIQAIP